MNTQQVTQAYADWCEQQAHDFYFVLNYQQHANQPPLSYEQLSAQVKRLFYKLECDEWGYDARESRWGRKYKRIERLVCIEKAAYFHANIMMKRYGERTDEALLEHIKRTWLEIQQRAGEWDNDFLFQPRHTLIDNKKAVSLYSNKDTAKRNKHNEDVLCLRASFIRKHSNRQ